MAKTPKIKKKPGAKQSSSSKAKSKSVLPDLEACTRLTDRKRASIVRAAVMEFQARGYYAASMNGIAQVAEVSKRTLYNHFDSKDALFNEMIEELLDRSGRLPACAFDAEGDLAEQLTELAHSEVAFLTSDAVQMLARAGMSRVLVEPGVGGRIAHKQLLRRVKDWLDEAYAAGCLQELDTDFAAQQFAGLLRTFTFWPSILHGEPKPSKKRRDQVVESTVEMFLARYAVGEE
ncbi:transcriptional regulator, TetR family [Neorhodopirellula lusitana]|uniref:Transcriptional regulator, TetR family n=1 Tax=Neorhodopirellula lusitana TaxID=445327 RepID=A0ABY1QFW6_9BACT|nr:TetR/AcrR family transcriptional regulator [Neorhodopirellula lusitana]SMP69560.1 transcriptional regulator, TetR family [Neorhodopirellula lusitana]